MQWNILCNIVNYVHMVIIHGQTAQHVVHVLMAKGRTIAIYAATQIASMEQEETNAASAPAVNMAISSRIAESAATVDMVISSKIAESAAIVDMAIYSQIA